MLKILVFSVLERGITSMRKDIFFQGILLFSAFNTSNFDVLLMFNDPIKRMIVLVQIHKKSASQPCKKHEVLSATMFYVLITQLLMSTLF